MRLGQWWSPSASVLLALRTALLRDRRHHQHCRGLAVFTQHQRPVVLLMVKGRRTPEGVAVGQTPAARGLASLQVHWPPAQSPYPLQWMGEIGIVLCRWKIFDQRNELNKIYLRGCRLMTKFDCPNQIIKWTKFKIQFHKAWKCNIKSKLVRVFFASNSHPNLHKMPWISDRLNSLSHCANPTPFVSLLTCPPRRPPGCSSDCASGTPGKWSFR